MPTQLLSTKLHIPQPRPSLVPRPRLIQRLDDALRLAHRLILVSASAGSGKTTLLSAWLASSDHPAAWLSLEPNDNDPARFLAYLVAAVQTLDPQVGQGVAGALQSPQPPPIDSLLTALVNGIADSARLRGAILVLDDYHVIQSQPVHQVLAFLLDHLPPPPAGPHLVIATRADPRIPLSRVRGRGQLTEIRITDLRFTNHEAAAFLRDVMGLDISAGAVAELEHRTEGWITGLQMAALSLQGRDAEETEGFVQAFAGSHRHILDYLLEEVLNRQPELVQRFLLETSILDQLSGPLCAATAGRPGAQAMLEDLERRNIFILPLDDERHWFHYHRLFRDLLRARLDQPSAHLGCAPAPELHRWASVWYEEQSLLTEAIGHAIAAGEVNRAAQLVEDNGIRMLMRGELTTLLGWLRPLGSETIDARPWLAIFAAWALGLTGQADEAETRLRAAEASCDAPPDDRLGHVAAIRSYIAAHRGDLTAAVALAHRAEVLLDDEDLVARSVVAFTLGGVHLLEGDITNASPAFAQAVEMGQAAGNVHLAVSAAAQLAMLEVEQGKLHEAFETCERMLAMAQNSPVAAQAHSGMGELLYEWNDLEAAAPHLERSVELGQRWGNVEALSGSYVALARLRWARDDIAGMGDSLSKAERLVQQGLHPAASVVVAGWRARLALAVGDLAPAQRWIDERGLGRDARIPVLREGEFLVRARLLLVRGEFAAAIPLLARLLESAQRLGRVRLALEAQTLQALAFRAQGDYDLAFTILEKALALAGPEGYIRTFVDEGEPLRQLLAKAIPRLADQPPVHAYAQSLLAAFSGPDEAERFRAGKAPHPRAADGQVALAEPLSERELEVLRLVADGYANREIATELFIALSTVKSHTNSIYGKLGVSSRTQAIVAARALGLL